MNPSRGTAPTFPDWEFSFFLRGGDGDSAEEYPLASLAASFSLHISTQRTGSLFTMTGTMADEPLHGESTIYTLLH